MKKRLWLVILGSMMCLMLAGCGEEDKAQEKEESYTKNILKQMTDEIGDPEITEFTEKKMAKEIVELRDDSKLICYAYTKVDMTGKYV